MISQQFTSAPYKKYIYIEKNGYIANIQIRERKSFNVKVMWDEKRLMWCQWKVYLIKGMEVGKGMEWKVWKGGLGVLKVFINYEEEGKGSYCIQYSSHIFIYIYKISLLANPYGNLLNHMYMYRNTLNLWRKTFSLKPKITEDRSTTSNNNKASIAPAMQCIQ